MLALAKVGPDGQLSITEIAEMEGLSVPYVSKLLAILRKAGLVGAVRGRSGGFSISRQPREISLYDVMSSLGGPLIEQHHCQKYTGQLPECVHIENCSMHDVFDDLAGYIREYLSETTIEELTSGKMDTLVNRIRQFDEPGSSNVTSSKDLLPHVPDSTENEMKGTTEDVG